MAETTTTPERPWGKLPAIDPDPATPMCGTVNGKIICCRARGHEGAHATPFPSRRRHGPVWVYWGGPPLGPFGSCHAPDPKTYLYCGLEKGHEGAHLSPSNQGPGATLAEWDAEAPRPEPGTIVIVPRDAPAPTIPERAHREGDQPLPHAGKVDVLAHLAATMPAELAARRAIGIRRYSRPLETWNGRDVHRDLEDELADALAYARQAKLERRDLEAEVTRLRAALAQARDDLDSHVKALDERITMLKAALVIAGENHKRAKNERDEALLKLAERG